MRVDGNTRIAGPFVSALIFVYLGVLAVELKEGEAQPPGPRHALFFSLALGWA